MTAADYVVCVVAVAIAMSFSLAWMPMLAAAVRYGWQGAVREWQRPAVYHGRPAARPQWPIPPGHHPKPTARTEAYRQSAGKPTVEERLDALERAEAARVLREMGEPSGGVVYLDGTDAGWDAAAKKSRRANSEGGE